MIRFPALLLVLACSTVWAGPTPEAYIALRMGDFDKAFSLFSAAAEEGSPGARYQLGKLYLAGLGTAQDRELGRDWLALAAADGEMRAQYSLGLLLLEVADSKQDGMHWLRQAADQGHPQAQARLEALAKAPTAGEDGTVELNNRWLEASVNCRTEELRALLETGIDPHSRDEYQRTALHYLVACDNREGVTLLLSRGLDPNARDQFDESALALAVKRDAVATTSLLLEASADSIPEPGLLHMAVTSGSEEMLTTLLAKNPPLEERNDAGDTPMELAIRLENHSAQRILQSAGAQTQGADVIVAPGATPWEAARQAALQRRADVIEALVRKHGEALLKKEDSRGRTLLMYAVEVSAAEVASVLLELGAPVDHFNSAGESALILAAAAGDHVLARVLLNSGADPLRPGGDQEDAILTALDRAENDEVASQLLDHIANTRLPPHRAARYILSATRIQGGGSVKRLLRRELQPDLADERGRTAAWYAARNCDDRTLAVLLDRSHSPSRADAAGRTPLHEAAGAGCESVIKRLLAAGSDPARATLQGNTPLMLAVQQGELDPARVLLEAGAPVSTANLTGDTPLIQAVRLGSPGLVIMLLGHGANPYKRNELGISAIGLAERTSPELARRMQNEAGLPF